MTPRSPAEPQGRRRIVRRIVWIGVAVLLLLSLPVALFSIHAVRRSLLAQGLDALQGSLPGSLEVASYRWPHPACIELEGIRLIAGRDTLLDLSTLELCVSFRDLAARRLRISRLTVAGSLADLAAWAAAAPAAPPPAESESAEPVPFLRAGTFPPMPAVMCDELQLDLERVRLPGGSVLADVHADLSADLSAPGEGRLDLRALRLRDAAGRWRIEETRWSFDLAQRTTEGRIIGHLSPHGPLLVEAAADEAAGFQVTAALEDKPPPPDGPGLVLKGRLLPGDDLPAGAAWTLDLLTPPARRLAADPALAELLADTDPEARLSARAGGRMTWHEAIDLEGWLRVGPSPWFERLEASVSHRPGVTVLESLLVHRDPVRIRASGSLLEQELETLLTLQAGRWGVAVEAWGRIERGEMLLARLAPVRVHALAAGETPSETVSPPALPAEPTLRFDPATGRADLLGLRLVGDAGDWTFSGTLDGEHRGRLAARADWMRVPPLLWSVLPASVVDGAVRDSIERGWRGAGPFWLQADADVDLDEPRTLRAEGRFVLPGPDLWAPLVMPQAKSSDWGPIVGTARFVEEPDPGGGAARHVRLDLTETAWIDAASMAAHAWGDTLQIDSLRIAIEDVALAAGGGISPRGLAIDLDATARGTRLLQRLIPSLPPADLLALDAQATLRGTPARPIARAAAGLHLRSAGLDLPSLSIHGRWRDSTATLRLDVDQKARLGPVELERVRCAVHAELGAAGDWTVRSDTLSLRIFGRRLQNTAPLQVRVLPEDAGFEIIACELGGTLGRLSCAGTWPPARGLRLEAGIPWPDDLDNLPLPPDLRAERLDLVADVHGADSLTARLTVTGLDLGPRRDATTRLHLSSGHGRLRAELTAGAVGSPWARARLDAPFGLQLHPFRTHLHDSLWTLDAELNDAPLPLLVGRGFDLGAFLRGEDPDRTVHLDGHVVVRGTPSSPAAGFAGVFRLPPGSQIGDYRIDLVSALTTRPTDAALLTDALRPDLGGSALRQEALPTSSDTLATHPAARGAFAFSRDANRLLEGHLTLPLEQAGRGDGRPPGQAPDSEGVEPRPVPLRPHASRPLRLTVDAPALDLAQLRPLLPASVDLRGRGALHLAATGPVSDPDLRGGVNLTGAYLATADGNRFSARSALTVAGTLRRPRLTGEMTIQDGILRIPDPPAKLHPTEGSAVLWELSSTGDEADASAAPAESDAGPQGPGETSPAVPGPAIPGDARAALEEAPPVAPEVQIRIRVPGRLWIRGRGLEAELAGDITVSTRGETPVVFGELQAVRGDLTFLGKRFSVERGQLIFAGLKEIDPELDLTLAMQQEQRVFRIHVRGTALNPELSLSSDPELPEGDIVSYLVFGRPLDQLDTGQTAYLRDSAFEAGRQSLAARLGSRLARRIGVDQLTIRSDRQAGGQALVIGKYLNRRTLVRYAQALDDARGFAIDLEYWLSQNIEVTTQVNKIDQSGIEVNWRRDY